MKIKLLQQKNYFIFIFASTIIFCLGIGLDISPYLRGPAPYPPEWRWPYLFVNTLAKIYLPIICILFLVVLFWLQETKNIFAKKINLLLLLLIILSFFFQLSILFFSRSGIPVLIHRIIDPTLNGYFTASLTIQNIPDFLRNYNQEMLQFVYHAKAHPPGAILLFYFIKQMLISFTFFTNFANQLNPAHSDVRQIWNILLPQDRATAVFSAFFIPFLSTLSLIPLYYSAKILYGVKVATRSIFLFFLIPTIVFFIPINDAFLHIFSITAFFFLLKGLKENHMLSLFLSGVILFLGMFFNLSLLPVLILFLIFALLFLKNKKGIKIQNYLKNGSFFSLGFFLPIILLYTFFQFNFVQVTQTIMRHVPDIHTRSYSLWLYYNIYDFFVFCGIPITIIFLTQLKEIFFKFLNKQLTKIDPVFISFLVMIIILNFSGSVRGETGRLWNPYIPFMVLITANFITSRINFSSKYLVGLIILQAIQILVMQEFWVMLW